LHRRVCCHRFIQQHNRRPFNSDKRTTLAPTRIFSYKKARAQDVPGPADSSLPSVLISSRCRSGITPGPGCFGSIAGQVTLRWSSASAGGRLAHCRIELSDHRVRARPPTLTGRENLSTSGEVRNDSTCSRQQGGHRKGSWLPLLSIALEICHAHWPFCLSLNSAPTWSERSQRSCHGCSPPR